MERQGRIFADERYHRDRKGRFTTKERELYEKTFKRNAYLEMELEKYKRQALAVVESNIAKDRQIESLRAKIEELKRILWQKQD